MRILLAEDDKHIVMIAKLTLEKVGGHQVDVAYDGQEALTKALSGNYDLILLDGMMPKMPGVEVCKSYQEQKDGPHARIIFLSAKSGQNDVNEYNSLGAGFIQKPFAPEKLCGQIDEILKDAA